MASTIVRVADLRQQVYETLKAQITNGDFAPNTKFQEIALAETLGVSRTPVREALALLVRDGLLMQMKRGFQFPRMTQRLISEITEVRLRLEPYAMAQMVTAATPKARKKLAQTMRGEIAAHKETDAYIAAHRRIRTALLDGVENRALVAAIEQFEDSIHMMRIATLREQRWRDKSAAGHLRIADAIEVGDPVAAETAQAELLHYARLSFMDYLEQLPDENDEV